MSKLAHQRAYEQYPQGNDGSSARIGYTLGYDQAFQDFVEKAEKFFNEELFTRFSGKEHRVASNKCMNLQQFIEQFKNYMENEM